jgi:hypothetical protein
VLGTVATAFLSALVPMSAAAALIERGLSLSFDGAATIGVPNIAPPSAAFVAEGLPAPVQQASTSSAGASLVPHKLTSIVVLTDELVRSSNAEALMRQILLEAVGPALDSVLFSTAAATADHPAGLRYNIAGLTPATAGTKSEIIASDLQALAASVAPVAGNSPVVIIASPDAAVALKLRLAQPIDWPILTHRVWRRKPSS